MRELHVGVWVGLYMGGVHAYMCACGESLKLSPSPENPISWVKEVSPRTLTGYDPASVGPLTSF